MQEAFFGFISQFGYLAVAALILFENVFPPIPSELILPLSGFLATQTEMTLTSNIDSLSQFEGYRQALSAHCSWHLP